MIDIVRPNKNEKQFVLMAKQLGFDALVMLYDDPKLVPKVDLGFPVRFAVLCPPSKVHSVRQKGLLAFCVGHERAREAIERSASVICSVEDERKDSLHFRRSGINQVLCRLMAQKKVSLAFSFADVLRFKGMKRAILLGRMMQNIMLCRKFKLTPIIASFADVPLRMRSPDDLRAFFHALGLSKQESLSSLRVLE